ncbi:MAG: hypothetical protein H6686_09990 [Fibrobacteria bacterium]|nr:hypothetical protein [Fibrobacteria bacterium]
MNKTHSLLTLLALGSATALFAFGGHGKGRHHGDGPQDRQCLRDSTDCPRMARAPLTQEQKTFLEAQRTLRDSMHLAMRGYVEAVRNGADPRSLPTERARISDFHRRMDQLRNDNLDVWLDIVATHPMMGPGGPGGMRPGRMGHPRCPYMQDGVPTDSTPKK